MRDRIPVFSWPSNELNGQSRIMPMRWLDLHHLREDAYSQTLTPYKSTHKQYLKSLAASVMSDPAGERTLMDWHLFSSGYVCPYDTIQRQPADAIKLPDGTLTTMPSIWLKEGARFTKEKLTYIFGLLKSYGLELDYYTTQHEWSLTAWNMNWDHMVSLEKDPRWKAWSKRLGFNTLDGVRNFWLSEENRRQMSKFNAELSYSTAEYLQKGLYSVLKKFWPRIKITDYAHFYIHPKQECYDINGWPMNTMTHGNPYPGACSDINYMSMNQFAWTAPAHIAPFANTPWNRFVMSLNQARAIKNSNKTKPFHPEFAGFKQMKDWNLADEKIYREHIFHAAITGADALQFWMIQAGDFSILKPILDELDQMIGGYTIKPVEQYPIEWHPEAMITQAKVGKKILTRITKQDFTGQWA
jgi:hypothetical protein